MELHPQAELFKGQKTGKPITMINIPIASHSDAKPNHVIRIANEEEIAAIAERDAEPKKSAGAKVAPEKKD